MLVCAVPAYGSKDAAAGRINIFRGTGRGGRGGCDGKVRAADHADDRSFFDEEGEANSILATTEEAFGTVNRVERPQTCIGNGGYLLIIKQDESVMYLHMESRRAIDDLRRFCPTGALPRATAASSSSSALF